MSTTAVGDIDVNSMQNYLNIYQNNYLTQLSKLKTFLNKILANGVNDWDVYNTALGNINYGFTNVSNSQQACLDVKAKVDQKMESELGA